MIPSSPQPFPIDIPFLRELGIEILSMADGTAQVALSLSDRHMNSWHVTHGGITMTLLDTVMSMAGRSLHPEPRCGVTVEMKTSFMLPAGTSGGRIVAKGKVLHYSKTMCFCEGEVWAGDKLVAKAMGTFKYARRFDHASKPA
jgi:acyl-CoA thioesterase